MDALRVHLPQLALQLHPQRVITLSHQDQFKAQVVVVQVAAFQSVQVAVAVGRQHPLIVG